MKGVNKIAYVSERDIDLLLIEELNVCQDFSQWFIQQIEKNWTSGSPCTGAWHSISDSQLGESDLTVLYEDGLAVLIENKIDAPAQPDQALRYRKRGEKGISEGIWGRFITCITAPERYLNGNAEANNYHTAISYETIRNWFDRKDQSRHKFKAYLLSEAIEQNRRGYSPIADNTVTQFWLSYWKLADSEFPSLEMPKPGIKPAGSDWPDFRPKSLGKKINIIHKMAQGFVDLQIAGAVDNTDAIKSVIADNSMIVTTAGKSAAVRIMVTPIDRFKPFDDQRDEIVFALQSAEKLLSIAPLLEKFQ